VPDFEGPFKGRGVVYQGDPEVYGVSRVLWERQALRRPRPEQRGISVQPETWQERLVFCPHSESNIRAPVDRIYPRTLPRTRSVTSPNSWSMRSI